MTDRDSSGWWGVGTLCAKRLEYGIWFFLCSHGHKDRGHQLCDTPWSSFSIGEQGPIELHNYRIVYQFSILYNIGGYYNYTGNGINCNNSITSLVKVLLWFLFKWDYNNLWSAFSYEIDKIFLCVFPLNTWLISLSLFDFPCSSSSSSSSSNRHCRYPSFTIFYMVSRARQFFLIDCSPLLSTIYLLLPLQTSSENWAR